LGCNIKAYLLDESKGKVVPVLFFKLSTTP